MDKIPPILEVGGILISSEILTEYFCCDYEKCKSVCCVEGSDGAPVLTTKNYWCPLKLFDASTN